MAHCAGLEGSLRDHIATTYGVSRNSILNSLKYFSVTNCLVPDVMHDILEGSLQLCTKLLLNRFIVDRRLFTLAVLNQRITSYKYGPAITEKPSSISRTTLGTNDGKLHQSGIILHACSYIPSLLQSDMFVFSITDVVFGPIFASTYWRLYSRR